MSKATRSLDSLATRVYISYSMERCRVSKLYLAMRIFRVNRLAETVLADLRVECHSVPTYERSLKARHTHRPRSISPIRIVAHTSCRPVSSSHMSVVATATFLTHY